MPLFSVHAALPQLDRGPDYESGRQGFESLTPHQRTRGASHMGGLLFSRLSPCQSPKHKGALSGSNPQLKKQQRPLAGARSDLAESWGCPRLAAQALRPRAAPSARDMPPACRALSGSNPQLKKQQRPLAGARSDLAESWGFEPQKGFAALTRLAGEHLRPLGQLSVC